MKKETRQSVYPFLWIALFYVVAYVGLSLPLSIRYYDDSYRHLDIARLPLNSVDFWAAKTPPTVPLFFKLAGYEDTRIVLLQGVISVFCWLSLAGAVAWILRSSWLKITGFTLILLLSLSQDVYFWHYMMLTESLSNSLFALTVAAWLMAITILQQNPQLPLKKQFFLAGMLIAVMGLWGFSRDTNAYVILAIGGFLSVVGVVWRKTTYPLRYAGFILIAACLLIFVAASESSRRGEREYQPVGNIMQRRILPNTEYTAFFREHGMPEPGSPEYQSWRETEARGVYLRFLLSRPLKSLWEPVQAWGKLFNTSVFRYSLQQSPPLPVQVISFVVYPGGFWLMALSLSGLILFGAVLRVNAESRKSAFLPIPGFLLLTVYPVAFLVWHGDWMEVERHALALNIHLRVGLWLLILGCGDMLLIPNQQVSDQGLKPLVRQDAPVRPMGLPRPLVTGLVVLLAGGFLAEAFLQNDFLLRTVTAPLLFQVSPDDNHLAAWDVPDRVYDLYGQLDKADKSGNVLQVYPGSMNLNTSLLDSVSLERLDSSSQDSLTDWYRTTLPGYLPDSVRYIYFDDTWWMAIPEFQRTTLQNPAYYRLIAEWQHNGTSNNHRIYQVVGRDRNWADQSKDAITMRGLSDEGFAFYQAEADPLAALTGDSLIFNPEHHLNDRLAQLIYLGRLISELPESDSHQAVTLMFFLEHATYPDELDLNPDEQAALERWRQSKLPEDLSAAGIEYLLVSQAWISYLSEETYHILTDPKQYELLYDPSDTDDSMVVYYLYRITRSSHDD